MVLDFHHHNIIFDADEIREGTKDIIDLFPRILATWKRKNITPKMHYSEPTPAAITGRQRRKHSPRVAMLPPCPPDMDLMIEAKDKEQAVFELMRTFKLPGFDTFNDIIPHIRKDDNKPVKTVAKKKTPKKKAKAAKTEEDNLEAAEEAIEAGEDPLQPTIADEEVGMGGPEGRVYWPPSMEYWLRPVKKVIKPKEPKSEGGNMKKSTPAQKKKAAAAAADVEAAEDGVKIEEARANEDAVTTPTPASKKTKVPAKAKAKANSAKTRPAKKSKSVKSVPTPSTSNEDADADGVMSTFENQSVVEEALVGGERKSRLNGNRDADGREGAKRQSKRAKKVSYAEEDEGDE